MRGVMREKCNCNIKYTLPIGARGGKSRVAVVKRASRET